MREPVILDGNRNIDLRSKLLEENIVLLDTDFNPDMASRIMQQLMYLDTSRDDTPVEIIIMSPGGCVHSGLAILDIVKNMKRRIVVTGTGLVASMGALFLSCAAKKGDRRITKNCQVMFHEVSAGAKGRFSDMEASIKHTKHLNDKLHLLISEATGQDYDYIKTLFKEDSWMEGEEVIKFGAADKVV